MKKATDPTRQTLRIRQIRTRNTACEVSNILPVNELRKLFFPEGTQILLGSTHQTIKDEEKSLSYLREYPEE
jgi:hypothetical protein